MVGKLSGTKQRQSGLTHDQCVLSLTGAGESDSMGFTAIIVPSLLSA